MTVDGAVSELAEPQPETLTADQKRMLRGFDLASPKMAKAFLRFADQTEMLMSGRYDQYVIDSYIENHLRNGYDIRAFLAGPPNAAQQA